MVIKNTAVWVWNEYEILDNKRVRVFIRLIWKFGNKYIQKNEESKIQLHRYKRKLKDEFEITKS